MKQISVRPNGTKKVVTINNEPSRTQQHHAKDCDINNIMAKYKKTGTITHVNNKVQGLYLDLTELPASYLEAELTLKAVDKAFHEIPAQTRLYFDNNPHKMLEFLKDKKNHEKAAELGLMLAPKKPDPKPLPSTPEPPKA